VVDVQASANLEEILPAIQKVGIEISYQVAGANGEVAVVAFDHRFRVMQDFTSEETKVENAFRQITPGGQNHQVIDAVDQSVRMLKTRPKERRRVILIIAEKRDNGSAGKLREVMEAVENANISIYAVDISSVLAGVTSKGQPPPPPPIPATAQAVPAGGVQTPTSIEQNYYNGNYIPVFVDIFKGVRSLFIDDTLDVFTRYTGGKQYSFVKKEKLDKAIESIGQEIHSQYLLSYVPNNQDEGGFHEIKVVVNRPGLEVRTRPGYWSAAVPQQQ
jgi:VWFA-related protein